MAGEPFYITTPIYYVNDSPHLGHAYTSVACDALARFMRLDGRQVLFLTGTDEHGQKVAKSARDSGVEPQAFCDRVAQNFRDMTKLMNVSNDVFIRTTEERHTKASQALWTALEKRGEIYLGRFKGWYSVRDEAFYEESELVAGKAPTGRTSNGSRRRTISSSWPPGRTGCSPITTPTPISSRRSRAATRW